MTALEAIEEFLLKSKANFIRVSDMYWGCGWFFYYDDIVRELKAHPWFQQHPDNSDIFRYVL